MGRTFGSLRIDSQQGIIKPLAKTGLGLPFSHPLRSLKYPCKFDRAFNLSTLRSRSGTKPRDSYLARRVIPIQPFLSVALTAERAYIPSQGGQLLAMISVTASYPSGKLPARLGLDAMVIWDISESISPFFSYSKHVLRHLLCSFHNCDAFGIITYGSSLPSEIFKLTFATDEVKEMAIETIEGTTASPRDRPGLNDAIRKAVERLNTFRMSNQRYSSIFILTDGNDEFLEHDASRNGISVFSLGIGALQNASTLFRLSRSGAPGGAYMNCDELEVVGNACHYASAGIGFEPFQNIRLKVLLEEGLTTTRVITNKDTVVSDTIVIGDNDLAPFETVRVFLQVQVSPTTQLQRVFAEINEMLKLAEEPILAIVVNMSYIHPALPTTLQSHVGQELYIYRNSYQTICIQVAQKYLEKIVFLAIQEAFLQIVKCCLLGATKHLKLAEDTLQTRREFCHWVPEMKRAVKAAQYQIRKVASQLELLGDVYINSPSDSESLPELPGNCPSPKDAETFLIGSNLLKGLPTPIECDSRIGSYYFNDPAQHVWLGMERERRGL